MGKSIYSSGNTFSCMWKAREDLLTRAARRTGQLLFSQADTI